MGCKLWSPITDETQVQAKQNIGLSFKCLFLDTGESNK